jgi:hypothetical protein
LGARTGAAGLGTGAVRAAGGAVSYISMSTIGIDRISGIHTEII